MTDTDTDTATGETPETPAGNPPVGGLPPRARARSAPPAPRHAPVPPPEGAVLLTVPEAAHELRCSVATVYREIGDGKLATRRVRGKTYLHREDLASYLDSARQTVRGGGSGSAPVPVPPTRQRISLRAAGLIDGDEDFGYKSGAKGAGPGGRRDETRPGRAPRMPKG